MPAEPALKKIASENGLEGCELEDLVQDEKVRAIALRRMQDVGRRSGFTGIEIIDGIVLVDEPWTPQNVSSPFPAFATSSYLLHSFLPTPPFLLYIIFKNFVFDLLSQAESGKERKKVAILSLCSSGSDNCDGETQQESHRRKV